DLDKNTPPGGCTLDVPPDVPPDGKPNTANTLINLVLLSANHGALLGSIGQFSNTNGGFLVGSGKSLTASKSGELYLIVNDTF
ncbi:MAG: hypothetical protein ACJ73Y_00835, partial [Rubrobacteraceae bacterium]